MFKSVFLFSFLLALQAHGHQYIQCWDLTRHSPDRLVVSLDKNRNTLFLSAEVNGDDPVNSGVLEMKKAESTNQYQSYVAKTEWANIYVHIPLDVIGKASREFQLKVEGILNSGEKDFERGYSCYSAMYE